MKFTKEILEKILFLLSMVLACLCSNSFYMIKENPITISLFMLLFAGVVLLPLYSRKTFPNTSVRLCHYGTKCLEMFMISTIVTIIYHIVAICTFLKGHWIWWIISIIVSICVEAIIFWLGIIVVYCTSLQLGIGTRILGVILGFIPIANLVMLFKIVAVTAGEVKFETEKCRLNRERKEQQICKTKYPILLVHGVFFRDSRYLNYWGRIPKELENNGATIYYGEHQSAASIEESAGELAVRIENIIKESGSEKVNIIAHSKGGLDCRYAIEHLDIGKYVASLVTINTPHRGCKFADYLLNKLPQGMQLKVAGAYNKALCKIGDPNPDFMAAVGDLTSERCEPLDREMAMPKNIYCASIGSKLNCATDGKFPLNFSYHLVKHFDGPNDGLVGEEGFSWGQEYTYLTIKGSRGISHGDMIDLNRENIPGFDVREFYVQLVSKLKQRGL